MHSAMECLVYACYASNCGYAFHACHPSQHYTLAAKHYKRDIYDLQRVRDDLLTDPDPVQEVLL